MPANMFSLEKLAAQVIECRSSDRVMKLVICKGLADTELIGSSFHTHMHRVICHRFGLARLHTSVARKGIIQNIYLNEIKAFKPKPLTEKDAAANTISWVAPRAPSVPKVEGDVSQVDEYAQAKVEVERHLMADGSSADVAADWFPIEDTVEDEHH